MSQLSPETVIDRLMLAAIDNLEATAATNRMNHLVAKQLGAVANLFGYPDIVKRVEVCLAKLSVADFFRGAITNIDWQNLGPDELDRLRRIEPAVKFSDDHPIYERNAPVPDLERFAQSSPHLKLCLQGDVTGALSTAKCELDFEEIADTLAALGRFDEAIALIDSQLVSNGRKLGVRFVVLLEKCRRLVPTYADEIAKCDPQDFGRLQIVLALAGRRPWVGYPYPDY
jgi:hypothetical protein